MLVKDEPGHTGVKEEPGHTGVKEEPGHMGVKEDPGQKVVKEEPAILHDGDTAVKHEAEHAAVGAVAPRALGDAPVAAVYTGPYPNLLRPEPHECQEARDALAGLHGEPGDAKDEKEPANCNTSNLTVLDSLVRTILSQNTTDVTSTQAFRSLKDAYATWDEVRTASPGAVEDSIRVGGLAKIKAERIQAILHALHREGGTCCLEHLRGAGAEEVKASLGRFKGVGPKTIACVMMFTLRRAEFPVDTHVWHIAKRLGWVPASATREQAYQHLNSRVPDGIKYDLHVLLVEHGKRCPSCSRGSSPRSAKRGTAQHNGTGCPLASLTRSPGATTQGGASNHPSQQLPDDLLADQTSPGCLKRKQQAGVVGRLGGKHRRMSAG